MNFLEFWKHSFLLICIFLALPQSIVIAVTLFDFEEHDYNDMGDPIEKHINKIQEYFCSTSHDESTVSLWEGRVETFAVKLDDNRNWVLGKKNTECLNQDIYKTTKIFLFLNERVWISWLRFFSTKFFMRILDSVSAIMTIGSLFAQVVPYWTI